jgi:hypothetical protein
VLECFPEVSQPNDSSSNYLVNGLLIVVTALLESLDVDNVRALGSLLQALPAEPLKDFWGHILNRIPNVLHLVSGNRQNAASCEGNEFFSVVASQFAVSASRVELDLLIFSLIFFTVFSRFKNEHLIFISHFEFFISHGEGTLTDLE